MLASQGARTTVRHASNYLHQKAAAGTSRGIHIPSFVRVHPRIPNLGSTQKLFSQSRHIVTQFFNLLTTPGLRVPTPFNAGRSLHGTARGYSTIQQGFTFHAKASLSRSSHVLPRAPSAVPRGIAQVGLGTARNFSSSRPIFQNLVENVPIAGRALYKADLDLRMREEKEMMGKSLKSGFVKKDGGKEMLKPRARDFSIKENQRTTKGSRKEAQLEQYFAAPTVPDVTTCLLIPIAPTPTARVPLSENPGSLLPLPALASIHTAHETHSLRVSSLFSRLDAANVWERRVQCSAFSHGGGAEGVCTMLKVEFIGWTKAEVRGVLGESGTGWCVLEETKTSSNGLGAFSDDDDDNLSETSSILSGIFEDSRGSSNVDLTAPVGAVDPSQSLFLPTLDFSSSFLDASSPAPTLPRSQAASPGLCSSVVPDSDFDPWLDSESSSDGGFSSTDSWVDSMSANGWNGFSSHFAGRVDASARPGEPSRHLF